MAELYPHKSGLGLMEPIALINHNVCVIYGNTKHYGKVTYLEPLPPFQALNIGAIAAQTVSARTAAPNLDLYDNEFGQFRWYPLDNAQIKLFLPNVDGRYTLRRIQVPVEPNIVDRDPDLHMTEFFEWEDNHPSFEAINFSDYALNACRIVCLGYRFVIAPASKAEITAIESGTPCVFLVASGFVGLT